MNKVVLTLIGFGAGAVAGAIGSKLYFEKKYAVLADKEIDSVKQMYLKKSFKQEESKPEPQKSPTKKTAKKSKKTKTSKQKVNYSDISTKEEEKTEEVKAEKEVPEEDEPMEPYEITFEEFDEEHPEYDKVNLSYYDEDGSVVTDDEEIIDPDDCIGVENLDKFVSDSVDEMYIRNNATSTDYDLVLVYGNYGKQMGL